MSYSWGAGPRVGPGGALSPMAEGPGTAVPVVPIPAPAIVDRPLPGSVPNVRTPGLDMRRLAAELAPMVDVWQRLLVEHLPDQAGRCRTCTKGGTGLPSTPWPCSIYGIADLARRRVAEGH